MKKTGAQIICECLLKEEVEVIFGIMIPCRNIPSSDIYWFAMSREQLMLLMAMVG
jgi:thiamine pyrophosphate-dependent acetolactate synthase large subunit-like protein